MKLEVLIERLLFASRWLLCPLYLGLALLLALFSVQDSASWQVSRSGRFQLKGLI